MFELDESAKGDSPVRITDATRLDELSIHLGRFLKVEGIYFNSLNQRGQNPFYARAGKLIGVAVFNDRHLYTTIGINLEGFERIDVDIDSKTLKLSILQSDLGIWKTIHEPAK